MNRFSYVDYRDLLRDLLREASARGRGHHSRLARHMQVHTTFLTHVLGGKSELSAEQALRAADFFSFSPLETDYFLMLIQWNRASDATARAYFKKKVAALRKRGFALKEQLKKESKMSVDDQAVFYSHWAYSAARLASALPEGKSIERIAKMIGLPVAKVAPIVSFLLQSGLCKIEKDRLTYNVFSTYVDSSSPFAKKLHDNWRLRSIEHGPKDAQDLMYTSAVTLTMEDFLKLRDVMLETLKTFEKVTDVSEPRVLAYLNLDWVRVT